MGITEPAGHTFGVAAMNSAMASTDHGTAQEWQLLTEMGLSVLLSCLAEQIGVLQKQTPPL